MKRLATRLIIPLGAMLLVEPPFRSSRTVAITPTAGRHGAGLELSGDEAAREAGLFRLPQQRNAVARLRSPRACVLARHV